MRELCAITSPETLEKSMHEDWKFQVAEKKKHGNYPTNILPSKVYIALYDTPPFSSSRKKYLKQLDNNWRKNHGENYQFVFRYKGASIPYLIQRVENYEDAVNHALGKLINDGIGISSIPLAKHLMNVGELQFDYKKI